MQRSGALNSDLRHCSAHPWGGPVRHNETIWIEHGRVLLLWNCPFQVFVAFFL